MSKGDEINRIYNEFLNSKKHLVDCMKYAREWEREGFNSFEDCIAFFLDTPDAYVEVIGQRHPLRGLRGLAALLLYFCNVERVEGATFEDCEAFIRKLFVVAPIVAMRSEAEAVEYLKRRGFDGARLARAEEHDTFKVDIIIEGVMGVQVKPESYKAKARKEPNHISFVRDREGWKRWVEKTGLPVFALYYKGVDPFIDWTLERLDS